MRAILDRTILLWCVLSTGCALAKPTAVDTPSEAARHRAALATIVVNNATTARLTIAFRSATLPVQEVEIGNVAAGERAHLAPVAAGEPIILIARRADGTELALAARSFPLDAEWLWEIPRDAKFERPAAK
jgi:hypothetical protein